MLKRQRQLSPPPLPQALSSSSIIPLTTDHPIIDERATKRRRTQPPVLDGTVRGWALGTEDEAGAGDSAEERWDEEEEEDEREGGGGLTMTTTTTTTVAAAANTLEEYKTTNSMLRDLHSLHQHRMSFSSSSSYAWNPPSSNAPSHHHLSSYPVNYPTPLPPSPHTKLHVPLLLQQSMHSIHKQSQTTTSGFAEEAGVVSEHYEQINKVLGSLFLSRRRALDSSSVNT